MKCAGCGSALREVEVATDGGTVQAAVCLACDRRRCIACGQREFTGVARRCSSCGADMALDAR